MFKVFVEGLELYAYHGVPNEEQTIGHRYIVDLEMEVAGEADRTDRVEHTVDYAAVAQLVLETAQQTRYRTVEKLARETAERILQRFDRVLEVRVRLAKRLPPAPVIVDEVGVEMTLRR
jgi:7,8-dihydroneopterin aldolase/epimerase/oxygenase